MLMYRLAGLQYPIWFSKMLGYKPKLALRPKKAKAF
jgi:hypothetical protein